MRPSAAAAAPTPRVPAAEGDRVVVVEDLESLEAHAEAWDALAARQPAGRILPHAAHAWMAATLAHKLEDSERWRCYLAYAGGELLGVLPLARRPGPPPVRARPRLRVPWEHYTRDGDVLVAPDREVEALGALLPRVRATEGPYLELRLGGVRDPVRVEAALRRARVGLVSREADRSGRLLRLDGDWETSRARLSSGFRRQLRRARKRLDALADVRIRFLEGPEATAETLERFLALEASGWKGERGQAILRSSRATAFYGSLVERMAARGALEWQLMEVAGELAAAHLTVRLGRTRTIVRIAYDERMARYSPGGVLLAETLRRSFERDDVDVVDCISDQTWHDRWRLERVPYHALVLHPLRPAALAFGALPYRVRRWGAQRARRRASSPGDSPRSGNSPRG